MSIVIHGVGNAQGFPYCCEGAITYYGIDNLASSLSPVTGYIFQPGDRLVIAYWADAQNLLEFQGITSNYSNTGAAIYSENPGAAGWRWQMSALNNGYLAPPYGEAQITVYNYLGNNNPPTVTKSLFHWWVIRGAATIPFVSFNRVTAAAGSLNITTPTDNCCVLGVSYPTTGPASAYYDGSVKNDTNKWNFAANGVDQSTAYNENSGSNNNLQSLDTSTGTPSTKSFFHPNLGAAGTKTVTVSEASIVDYVILSAAPAQTLTTVS
jgi:hypothetical protein